MRIEESLLSSNYRDREGNMEKIYELSPDNFEKYSVDKLVHFLSSVTAQQKVTWVHGVSGEPLIP